MLHAVLVEPEIHFNTGNVGRTCVGLGAALHLVGRLGFSLDGAQVRRAGLDYWPKLDLRLHDDFRACVESLPAGTELFFFSAEAPRLFWDAPFSPGCALVFGKESTGLPADLRERYADRLYRVPHSKEIRSLNLSTVAGIVLYEAARRLPSPHWGRGLGEGA